MKKKYDYDRIIYSLNIQDIQNVLEENFGKKITFQKFL